MLPDLWSRKTAQANTHRIKKHQLKTKLARKNVFFVVIVFSFLVNVLIHLNNYCQICVYVHTTRRAALSAKPSIIIIVSSAASVQHCGSPH